MSIVGSLLVAGIIVSPVVGMLGYITYVISKKIGDAYDVTLEAPDEHIPTV